MSACGTCQCPCKDYGKVDTCCQVCQTPCFDFFKKAEVCPQELGIHTSEQYQQYLDYFHPNTETSTGDLIDSSDGCPMFEDLS